jgi:signal transduction histidine kinase
VFYTIHPMNSIEFIKNIFNIANNKINKLLKIKSDEVENFSPKNVIKRENYYLFNRLIFSKKILLIQIAEVKEYCVINYFIHCKI